MRRHYHTSTLHAFYRDAAVLARESLRLHPLLRCAVRRLWRVYVHHLGPRMHREGYLLVAAQVQRCVHAWHAQLPASHAGAATAELAVEPGDASAAAVHARAALLRQDWLRDSGGAETIGWDGFYAAMFQARRRCGGGSTPRHV